MSDEIETIDKNPKSWDAWKREAERLQAIIDGMALAAMDSEPVAWISQSNLDALIRGHDALVKSTDNVVQPVPLYRHAQQPVVSFYRDGIEAAAKWIDEQREAYDSEHGWSDPDTGAFEFGNDAQREYSSTLEELAEGIRALHPNAGMQPAPVVLDDVQRDAKRWRALLGSARIRILGSAGFDATAHPGENPDYRHFGMEIWTHHPDWPHEKNEYGINTLIQYADAMLAAAPQEVK